MKKRILLRASVSPFEVHTPASVITDGLIGNNTGNLIFAYSMTRTLYCDDTEISFLPDKDVVHDRITPEFINENYDYLVLPMANSFRESFVACMDKWSALIEKLTIPCVITGVGIQMPYEPNIKEAHSYDESAKRFITAVLNHSASVGVRGEITYKYLKHLGFNNIDVTGCPSLETFGPGLPIRERKPLTAESSVCVTGSVSNPVNFKEFMMRNRKELPNYYFMPQFVDDLKLMYLGIPLPETKNSQILYPNRIDDEVFVQDKARFFFNFPSIIEFNQGIDFNYGTRIHGAVGSILAGVPSLLFPTDARIRELAEYHNIPNIPVTAVDENTNIFDLYEKTDFAQVNVGHEERFWHFVDFLNENGLPHVYRNFTDKESFVSPFDEKMKTIELPGPAKSIYSCSRDELLERYLLMEHLTNDVPKSKKKEKNKTTKNSKTLNAKIKKLQKKNKAIQEELDWYNNASVAKIAISRMKNKHK